MGVTSPRAAIRGLGSRLPEDSPEILAAAARGLTGIGLMVGLAALRGNWLVGVLAIALALTVPGTLALRALRVSSDAVGAFPIYIPAASVLVLMVGGLAADLVGPVLGVDRPLVGATPVLATAGVCLLLLIAGARRPSFARLPWTRLLTSPALLLTLPLPLLAAGGALLMNNGHGSLLARISAVLVVVVFVVALLRSRRLTNAQIAMVLFSCALAAEWAFSLRSQFVVGFDISTEIHIAQAVHAAGVWHAHQARSPYAAMLSLTVLPSTLSALTGLSPLIAFKVLYPALAALIPVSVYLLARRQVGSPFAMAAGGLLLVQNYFFEGMPQLARQEIGLLFAAVLTVALLDGLLSRSARMRVASFAALALVLSHYSSAYLAIAMVLMAVLIQLMMLRFNRKVWSPSLLCCAVVLIGGAALWYGPVTHSANNLTQFSSSLDQHGLDLFPTQREHQGVVNAYLGGNAVTGVGAQEFETLAVQNYKQHAAYVVPLPASRDRRYALQTAQAPATPVHWALGATAISDAAALLGEIMLVLGVGGAVLMVVRRSSLTIERRIGLLALSTLPFLILVRFSGTTAQAYNQQRALLQSLIVLAIPAAWAARELAIRARRYAPALGIATVAGFALVFVLKTGVSALVLGGGTSLNLSQSGEDFERLYVTAPELAAATWANTISQRGLLYADRYGQLRLFQTTGRVALTEVTPQTIDQNAWVYGSRTNIILGRARGEVGSFTATYVWPSQYLNANLNTVFTDGDSEIFH